MPGGAGNSRSRGPLLPKEMIVPVCWRLTLICSVMCGSALCIRLFTMWRMHSLANSGIKSSFPVNGSHFFFDVGLNSDEESRAFSHTKHLEQSGWRGVCANPFPDETRSCKAVAIPVAPRSGQEVEVSDCSAFVPLLHVFTTLVSDCPKSQRTAMSIAELLMLSKAPPIIDYLVLDSQGTELEILERFPFQKFCVKAWTVKHRYDILIRNGIKNVLDLHGCKVKDAGPSYWARCSCSGFAESLLAEEAVSSESRIHQVHSTQAHRQKLGKKKNARALVPMLDHPVDMSMEFDAAPPSLMRKD